jgi:hypothetical protein
MRKLGQLAIVIAALIALTELPRQLDVLVRFIGSASLERPSGLQVLLAMIPAAACLAIVAYLLSRREALAERWFGSDQLELAVDEAALARVALAVFGVILIVDGVNGLLASLVGAAANLVQVRELGLAIAGGSLLFALMNLIPIALGALLIRNVDMVTNRFVLARVQPGDGGGADEQSDSDA